MSQVFGLCLILLLALSAAQLAENDGDDNILLEASGQQVSELEAEENMAQEASQSDERVQTELEARQGEAEQLMDHAGQAIEDSGTKVVSIEKMVEDAKDRADAQHESVLKADSEVIEYEDNVRKLRDSIEKGALHIERIHKLARTREDHIQSVHIDTLSQLQRDAQTAERQAEEAASERERSHRTFDRMEDRNTRAWAKAGEQMEAGTKEADSLVADAELENEKRLARLAKERAEALAALSDEDRVAFLANEAENAAGAKV